MNFWTGLILGLIIGWVVEWIIDYLFWRRGSNEAYAALEARLAASQGEVNDLQSQLNANSGDLDGWRNRYASLETDCQARIGALETTNAQLLASAAVMGTRSSPTIVTEIVHEDDLTIIEGIGPTYNARLRENGVVNFAQLAAMDESQVAAIIQAPAWRRANYGDWIEQARLAAAGDEAGLRALQDRLNRREDNRLTRIYGIGDSTAVALEGAGIQSYNDLAAAKPEQLAAIMAAAGLRGGDYEAWIEEARLRAAGRRVSRRRQMPEGAVAVVCPQDLSAVAGIGSVYEQKLYRYGVGSYWELSQLSDEVMADILEVKPHQNVNYEAIRTDARAWAERTDSVNRVWDGTEPDDFEVMSGIGELYERRLYNAGICTYEALAATSPERLAEICQAPRMRQPNYTAWVAEAQMLAANKGTRSSPTIVTEIVHEDDLTIIEGIGPTYNARLRENGVVNFAQLAAMDESQVAAIIQAPAWRKANYGDWIEQARLAAAGDEAGLRALQDRLNRREDNRLTRIYGIGDSTAVALEGAGIQSYNDLAAAKPEQLAAIMAAAGLRGGDYEAWIEEARLRAAGRRVARRRLPAGAVVVSCPQDLSAVDGIGSVYEQKLYSYGIGSYWELSQAADETLAEIFEVKAFQNVNYDSIRASASEWAQQTDSVSRVWDGTEPDDFEVLEGIGELYERRLYGAGICTYEALAGTSVERLAEICQAPRMRQPDYAAWIEEARALAANKGG